MRCGIDVVEVRRMERLLAHCDASQLRVIFTDGEVADCAARPDPARWFAARFAVKEACLKVFPRETGLAELDFADVPVRLDAAGAARVELRGTLARLAKRNRIRALSASLSHTRDCACGVVVAE